MTHSSSEQWKEIDMSSGEEDSKSETKELKVEDVYEQLGGFSKFQVFAAVVILALEAPGAMVALSPILISTNHVDFYCSYNDTHVKLSKDQLCNKTCQGQIVSKEPIISIVQEWNLICDKAWISDTLTSLQMAGGAVGPLLTAQISDRYGRKPAFYTICILIGLSGVLSSQTTDIVLYAFSKFIAGMVAAGCLVAHMNYLLEFLTPSWRVVCGSVSLWPVGEMLLGIAGYFFPSWRTLSWISIVPCAALLLTFPLLPESPRWLLCKNKSDKAQKVFKQIAKWNSKPELDAKTFETLKKSIIKNKDDNNATEETDYDDCGTTRNNNDTNKNKKSSAAISPAWKTFKETIILKQLVIFSFAWFSNSLTYYGISFNMKNMNGNPYLNVFLLGLLDFPAELSGIYFSNRFGRKVTFITFLLASVLFLIAVAGVQLSDKNADVDYGVAILVLCLIGRFCNEASWGVMACFTGESFPTIVRSICFSICTVSSCLGGILAPQMAYFGSLWTPGPYVVFSILCTLSCCTSLLLVEMNKNPLKDIRH